MRFNPTIHKRRSIRLSGWNYSQSGGYFITLCTQGRECLFGDIISEEMCLNPTGQGVRALWAQLPAWFPGIILDEFIVMPNHLHGILFLGNWNEGEDENGGAASSTPTKVLEEKIEKDRNGDADCRAPTLGRIIRA